MNTIDPLGTNQIAQPEAKDTQPVKGKGKYRPSDASATEELAGKDQASLSEEARLLAKARLALAEAPEVRNSLVEELRSRISSGQYQIPYEKLAELLAKWLV